MAAYAKAYQRYVSEMKSFQNQLKARRFVLAYLMQRFPGLAQNQEIQTRVITSMNKQKELATQTRNPGLKQRMDEEARRNSDQLSGWDSNSWFWYIYTNDPMWFVSPEIARWNLLFDRFHHEGSSANDHLINTVPFPDEPATISPDLKQEVDSIREELKDTLQTQDKVDSTAVDSAAAALSSAEMAEAALVADALNDVSAMSLNEPEMEMPVIDTAELEAQLSEIETAVSEMETHVATQASEIETHTQESNYESNHTNEVDTRSDESNSSGDGDSGGAGGDGDGGGGGD